MTITNTETVETDIDCVACGETHPRRLSVTVASSGLACGLACMTKEQRMLLGLPDPEHAEIGAFPTPPFLKGWRDKPSKYFQITTTGQLESGTTLNQEHFRQAMNHMGLGNILMAAYKDPEASLDLIVAGAAITLTFQAYAAGERLHITIKAFNKDEPPKMLAEAGLSWMDTPDKPERQRAQRAALEFLSRNPPNTESQH